MFLSNQGQFVWFSPGCVILRTWEKTCVGAGISGHGPEQVDFFVLGADISQSEASILVMWSLTDQWEPVLMLGAGDQTDISSATSPMFSPPQVVSSEIVLSEAIHTILTLS